MYHGHYFWQRVDDVIFELRVYASILWLDLNELIIVRNDGTGVSLFCTQKNVLYRISE